MQHLPVPIVLVDRIIKMVNIRFFNLHLAFLVMLTAQNTSSQITVQFSSLNQLEKDLWGTL